MFITGGTGVGKSTQIPKLISYASVAIDHIPNGRTVCTEPRINAVKNNVDYISKLIGLVLPNNKADNNLQYYTSEDKNKSRINIKSPVLKIETDGFLLNEIIKYGKYYLLDDNLIKDDIMF